jgi:hypothetical protein
MVQDHCISVNRVDTGPTRCAYEHTTTTSTTPTEERRMESWKLDNMLYTSDRLSPLARWSTLEADSESCATGLPNAKCPSDHLPIACIFAIQPSSELDALKRQEVLARLQELSIRHQHTLNDTEIAMEAKHQDISKNLAATISSSSLVVVVVVGPIQRQWRPILQRQRRISVRVPKRIKRKRNYLSRK